MTLLSATEWKEKKSQDKKHKKSLLDKIDLSKKYPNHIDKKIIRAGFIVVLIIQVTALFQTGFNFSPAWVECGTYENLEPFFNSDVDCKNPFYNATGNICNRNPNLCTTPTVKQGEILGIKPNSFVRNANNLSWLALISAGIINYRVCKKRRLT